MKLSQILVTPLVVTSLLFVAACGNDDSSGGSAAESEAPPPSTAVESTELEAQLGACRSPPRASTCPTWPRR